MSKKYHKIVIDAYVPFTEGVFTPWFDTVEYVDQDAITPQVVADADALIVRTRTRCNAEMLSGSRCQFVGTATIGTDHIDFDYCKGAGITTASAPGCNAPAVAQYVISVIAHWMRDKMPAGTVAENLTVGVVGAGHVGSIVVETAQALGFRTLVCDPPRSRAEGNEAFVDLDTLLAQSDIVTAHTPLTHTGEDATYHLINNDFIAKASSRCRLLINAARGAVADTTALLAAPATINLAIDCWEGEPNFNRDLMTRAYIATPHIAGYSQNGKLRASAMVIKALAQCLDLQIDVAQLPQFAPIIGQDGDIDMGRILPRSLTAISASYDPMIDDALMRGRPNEFEALRNYYNLRPEAGNNAANNKIGN